MTAIMTIRSDKQLKKYSNPNDISLSKHHPDISSYKHRSVPISTLASLQHEFVFHFSIL